MYMYSDLNSLVVKNIVENALVIRIIPQKITIKLEITSVVQSDYVS